MTTYQPTTGTPAASGPSQSRIDVLAVPSPTAARSIVLVVALLTAGLFVGTWLHNTTAVGDRWTRAVAACEQQSGAPPAIADLEQTADQQHRFAACTAPVERVRAAWATGGLLIAGAGGLAVLYVVPVVVRRRRRLSAPGPNLAPAQARFAALSAEAGLRRPPRLVVGRSTQTDAFSFGTPRHYLVAVPKKLAVSWRRPDDFDPLIRHELAHIAGHDVPAAWLSRSLVYVLVPLLSVPVVVSLLTGEPGLALDFTMRAVLLAGVAVLVAQATLRSREYDADLRAVARQPSGEQPLLHLLARVRPSPTRRLPWARAFANHPDPAERAAVVITPELRAAVPFLDGLAAAFLTALSAPLVVAVLITVLAPAGRTDTALAVAHLAVGPLLGATVGLGLWRRALVAGATSVRGPVTPVALGVALGLLLGQAASLAGAALGVTLTIGHPAWLVLTPALGFGATVVVAGLADLWAQAATRSSRSRVPTLVVVAVSSIVFSAALWGAEILRTSMDLGGWLLTSGTVISTLGGRLPVGIALLLGAVVVLGLVIGRHPSVTAPSWLTETGPPLPWSVPDRGSATTALVVGAVAGLVGATSIVGYSVLAGPHDEFAQQRVFLGYLWVAAACGGAAAAALSATVPRRGAALALLAAPVASLTAVTGILAVTLLEGRALSWGLLELFLKPIGFGLFLTLPAAGVAVVGGRIRGRSRRGVVAAGAATTALLLSATVLVAHPALTGFTTAQDLGAGPTDTDIEQLLYLDAVAPDAVARFRVANEQAQRLAADTSLQAATRAERMSTGPAEDLRDLSAELDAQTYHDSALRQLHRDLVACAELEAEAIEHYAEFVRTGAPGAGAQAAATHQQALDALAAWLAGLAALDD
jgi:hypothetical protein